MTALSPYFFVLGSPDHEMREIERVATELGIPHGYAHRCGTVVKSHNAYQATGVGITTIPPGSRIVYVESQVMGLRADDIIDHHNVNDPGYGKSPAQFYEGSSIGQFLTMLGRDPTPRQRVIAAADHCLSAAYRGECPGITFEALKEFRESTRAQARRISREELSLQIQHAVQVLKNAARVQIAGASVAWFDSEEPPAEIAEASARISQPYVSITKREDGRVKAVLQSAPAYVVKKWLTLTDLVGTYGDPQRGFAGGYFR